MKEEYTQIYLFVQNQILDYERQLKKPLTEALIDNCLNSDLNILCYKNKGYDEIQQKELIAEIKHKIIVENATTFVDMKSICSNQFDHEPWLNAKNNDIKWDHWHAYKKVLVEQNKSILQANKVQKDTNILLDYIEYPKRPGSWDIRGLVVGDVQAGKTSNYIGLMAKAVDAGYRVLIVLAGITSDLRKQTQKRIDDGLLGYDTTKQNKNGIKLQGHPGVVINTLTNCDQNGDYTKGSFGPNIRISDGSCTLYVIKKNVSILRNVYYDIFNNTNGSGKLDVPLLLIDDEADNASINNKQSIYDPETGSKISPKELDPSSINRYIRAILNCFTRSVYIGYTATPYANIFGVPDIERDKKFKDKNGKIIEVGEDLFPRNFISYLESPENYYGPERVFGLNLDTSQSLPIVVNINKEFPDDLEIAYDDEGEPIISSSGHEKLEITVMPESLKYAIKTFFLSCASKECRNVQNKHNTMLIHVERLTVKHRDIKEWILSYIEDIKNLFIISTREMKERFFEEMRYIWENDFEVKTEKIKHLVSDEAITDLLWEDVKELLKKYITGVEVAIVNGTKAASLLDYENYPKGKTVIAIGGDKLARGLTLEGLTTSYFLRSSQMFDTLAQMGRWFGYRDGYIDLCRIYATGDILRDFIQISMANHDLKEQFELLQRQPNKTPKDFGLRVRTLPNTKLLVTSKIKAKNTKKEKISFSGQPIVTAYLSYEQQINASNLEHYKEFIIGLGKFDRRNSLRSVKEGNSYCWNNVSSDVIVEKFLNNNLIIDDKNSRFRISQIADYIQKMSSKYNEVKSWTVALIGGDSKKQITISNDVQTPISIRSCELVKNNAGKPLYYEINQRRLSSGNDEAYDLSSEEFEEAIEYTKENRRQKGKDEKTDTASSVAIRGTRKKENALLLIYFVEVNVDDQFKAICPAFLISFPCSDHPDVGVEYWNNIVAQKNSLIEEQVNKLGRGTEE